MGSSRQVHQVEEFNGNSGNRQRQSLEQKEEHVCLRIRQVNTETLGRDVEEREIEGMFQCRT